MEVGPGTARMDAPRMVVIGGGIGGLAAAVALQAVGADVVVLERAQEPGEVGAGITLFANALRALDVLGLGDAVRSLGSAVTDGGVRRPDGKWLARPRDPEAMRRAGIELLTVHRAELHRLLAAQAGAIMREHFRSGVAYRDKGDGTPVTLADQAINDLVVERVAAQYPSDGVIGEEGDSSAAGSSGRVWVCDPIDGTLPFTLGVPTNLFSLALVEDGVPTMGILYDPYLDRMYEAALGDGALVNGVPLRVSDTPLGDAILALPGAQFGLTDNAALASDVIARGMRTFSVSSVTYDGALVAAGQIAACVFPDTSVWDIAAVKVLVEEAGGMVTDIDGNSQRYDQPIRGALLSNKRAHDELVELVRPHLFNSLSRGSVSPPKEP